MKTLGVLIIKGSIPLILSQRKQKRPEHSCEWDSRCASYYQGPGGGWSQQRDGLLSLTHKNHQELVGV